MENVTEENKDAKNYISLINSDEEPIIEEDPLYKFYRYKPTLISNLGMAEIVLKEDLEITPESSYEVRVIDGSQILSMDLIEAQNQGFLGLRVTVNNPTIRHREINSTIYLSTDGKDDTFSCVLVNDEEETEEIRKELIAAGKKPGSEIIEGTTLSSLFWKQGNDEIGDLFVKKDAETLKNLKFRFEVEQGGEIQQ